MAVYDSHAHCKRSISLRLAQISDAFAPSLLPLLPSVQKNLCHPRSSAANFWPREFSLCFLRWLLFKSLRSGLAKL
jgi:hypothetical protein